MAKKKKPDQDSKKGKPEETEELSEMMSMDEDWEILELTERTIVRQAPDDEETISLSPPGMKDEDEDDDYTFIAEESGEAPAAEYQDPPEEDNGSPNDFELELESDDDQDKIESPEALEVELEMEEEVPEPVKKETPKKKKAVPEIEDLADFSELEEEIEEEKEEENEEEEAPKKSKKKPAKKKNAAKKGPLIGIVVVLSLVLVALVVVIVLLLQRQPGEPRMTASKNMGQSITKTVPAPAVESKPLPAPAPRSIPTPKTARPAPPPQPTAPPVARTKPVTAPATRQLPSPTTTAPVQPATPAPTPAPEPVAPTSTPAATVTPAPPETATIVADPNMVHRLSDIDFRKTGDTLQVKIMANGPVGGYNSFPLSSPPRLVIDLPGNWEKPPFLEKKVATGYISRIRLGQHDDKLRIVADLRTSQALSPVFTPTRDGLTINLSIK